MDTAPQAEPRQPTSTGTDHPVPLRLWLAVHALIGRPAGEPITVADYAEAVDVEARALALLT